MVTKYEKSAIIIGPLGRLHKVIALFTVENS